MHKTHTSTPVVGCPHSSLFRTSHIHKKKDDMILRCDASLLLYLFGITTTIQEVVGWSLTANNWRRPITSPSHTITLWSSDAYEEELNPLFSMDPDDLSFDGEYDQADDDDDEINYGYRDDYEISNTEYDEITGLYSRDTGDSLFSAEDYDAFGDSVMVVDNPGSLQQMLRGADNTLWGSNMTPSTVGGYNKGLDASTLDKLREIVLQEEARDKNSVVDSKLEFDEIPEDDDDDGDTFFLSEDEYMKASMSINPDGSLPEYMFDRNSKMWDQAAEEEEGDEEMTMQDLMQALKKQEAMPDDDGKKKAKELRDQVFSQEEAFNSLYVESAEYKVYEAAILRGLEKKKKQESDVGDELDLALEELQQMIDAKKWGESQSQPDAENGVSDDSLDDEELS